MMMMTINNSNSNGGGGGGGGGGGISSIDLKIKFKFSRFLDDFEVTEYQRVMRFMKRVLVEYEENPFKLLGNSLSLSLFFCTLLFLNRGNVIQKFKFERYFYVFYRFKIVLITLCVIRRVKFNLV
jgi:hypothetical protein